MRREWGAVELKEDLGDPVGVQARFVEFSDIGTELVAAYGYTVWSNGGPILEKAGG